MNLSFEPRFKICARSHTVPSAATTPQPTAEYYATRGEYRGDSAVHPGIPLPRRIKVKVIGVLNGGRVEHRTSRLHQ